MSALLHMLSDCPSQHRECVHVQRRARASKKELKVMFKDEAKRHQQAGAAASTIPMP